MQARSAAGSHRAPVCLAAAVALIAALIGVTLATPGRAHASNQQQVHKHVRGHVVLLAATADTLQPTLRTDVPLVVADHSGPVPASIRWAAVSQRHVHLLSPALLTPRTRGPPATAN